MREPTGFYVAEDEETPPVSFVLDEECARGVLSVVVMLAVAQRHDGSSEARRRLDAILALDAGAQNSTATVQCFGPRFSELRRVSPRTHALQTYGMPLPSS